jgi:hypothetical protein
MIAVEETGSEDLMETERDEGMEEEDDEEDNRSQASPAPDASGKCLAIHY